MSSNTPDTTTPWILVVDDEQNILKALKRELRPLCRKRGCRCRTFTSATLALTALRGETSELEGAPVAAVLTDQRMPEMSGGEFLIILKKEFPQIPAMVLTGFADIKEMGLAIEGGAYAYLFKPWEPEQLLRETEKLYQIYQDRQEKHRYMTLLREELSWAGQLQKTLLSGELPREPALDFQITYQPLPELYCGGDYYDIIPLSEGRYLALVGDVAGHGVKAAFITTILKSIIYRGYIRNHREGNFSPAGFLSWLNKRLCRELKSLPDMLVTMAALLIDVPKQEALLGSAGHNPCGLLRKGQWKDINIEGGGLGIFEETRYKACRFSLKEGDTLFLYTDGLVELDTQTTNNSENPLPAMLQDQSGPGDHQELLQAVLDRKKRKAFSDDVTLLTITYTAAHEERSRHG